MEEVETYVTLDEDTGSCFECGENQVCKIVQGDAINFAKVRAPKGPLSYDRKTNERIEAGAMRICGRKGTFVHSRTAIKVLPMSREGHRKRREIWTQASVARVGPEIADPADIRFREFRRFALKSKAPSWGWSSVQMEKLQPIHEPELVKAKELITLTALSGLMHMDPSMDNIMMRDNGTYVFVDWEDGIKFEPRKTEGGVCPFCNVAEAFMMVKLSYTLRSNGTENFSNTVRKDLRRMADAAANSIPNSDVVNMIHVIRQGGNGGGGGVGGGDKEEGEGGGDKEEGEGPLNFQVEEIRRVFRIS